MQTVEDAQALKPVWLRIPAAARVSGLSRTHIFEAIATDKIRSKHIKRPGAQKGIRLVHYESLLAYIESL